MDFVFKKFQQDDQNVMKSARLEMLISALGVSQKDFASKISMSETSISQILSGKRNLTNGTALDISRIFPNVNLEWLLTGTGDMFKSDIVEEPGFEYGKPDKEEVDLRAEVERLKAENARLATALLREQGLSDDLRELLKKLAGTT